MSIIIMILLISLLILVHEAGHFLVAKMFKMKVSKFAFGLPIGPTLWKKKFGDLEVLVHAFLLGGYVAFPDDDKEVQQRGFMSTNLGQEMMLLFGGNYKKQQFISPNSLNGVDERKISFNTALFMYEQGLHVLLMPCGEVSKKCIDVDGMNIFE